MQQNLTKTLLFWDNCIWIGIVKLWLLRTGFFSSLANVLTSSPKIPHVSERDLSQLNWIGCYQSIWYRWCDVYFNRVFRHLCNYVFRVRNLGNTKAVRVILFFKMFKIKFKFQNFSEQCRKLVSLNWIGIVKLFLLRTAYFSSAANVLTSSPKIFHVNKRDSSQLNWLGSDHWIW